MKNTFLPLVLIMEVYSWPYYYLCVLETHCAIEIGRSIAKINFWVYLGLESKAETQNCSGRGVFCKKSGVPIK